jgi:IclR family transcriptional regulator, pca regulon regulatory protein
LKVTIITDRKNGYSLVDREADPGFRSIGAGAHYDDTIVSAINMDAHGDWIPTGEMIDRLLPLLCETAATVNPCCCISGPPSLGGAKALSAPES